MPNGVIPKLGYPYGNFYRDEAFPELQGEN